MEAIPLFKAYRTQTARGVFHETQGVQHAQHAFLDVPLPAEKVHQLPVGRAVQTDGQGIDGEVAPEQVHLDG